jgi:hypothetical protein
MIAARSLAVSIFCALLSMPLIHAQIFPGTGSSNLERIYPR